MKIFTFKPQNMLRQILIGISSLILGGVILFFIQIRFKFLGNLNNEFGSEIYTIILFTSLLVFLYSNNDNIKSTAIAIFSIYSIFILVRILANLLYFDVKLSTVVTIFILTIIAILIFIVFNFLNENKRKFIKVIISCFVIILLLDVINMYFMFLSLKKIDDAQYIEELDNIDTDLLHYSIYAELDTFNVSDLIRDLNASSELLLPYIPPNDELKEELKNYDFYRVNKGFYVRPYLILSKDYSRRDIVQFNFLRKFFEEYYITWYSDRIYYVKHKKTGTIIQYKKLMDRFIKPTGV